MQGKAEIAAVKVVFECASDADRQRKLEFTRRKLPACTEQNWYKIKHVFSECLRIAEAHVAAER